MRTVNCDCGAASTRWRQPVPEPRRLRDLRDRRPAAARFRAPPAPRRNRCRRSAGINDCARLSTIAAQTRRRSAARAAASAASTSLGLRNVGRNARQPRSVLADVYSPGPPVSSAPASCRQERVSAAVGRWRYHHHRTHGHVRKLSDAPLDPVPLDLHFHFRRRAPRRASAPEQFPLPPAPPYRRPDRPDSFRRASARRCKSADIVRFRADIAGAPTPPSSSSLFPSGVHFAPLEIRKSSVPIMCSAPLASRLHVHVDRAAMRSCLA